MSQAFDGSVSLLLSCRWRVGRERPWCWLHPLRVTQQYRLASMAAWLSSTGISHHSLLPHIPLICLSAVNSSPPPGITPQSLISSSQLLRLSGDLHPYPGYAWLWQGLSDAHSFRLTQISCFTPSLKCFSSDSDNCPHVGTGPLVQFPHLLRAGPVLLRLLFFPLVPCPIEFCVGHNRLVPNRKRSTSRLYIVTLLI